VQRPHPRDHDRFQRAIEHEDKVNYETTAMQGRQYTWSQGESLRELIARRNEIEQRHQESLTRAARWARPNLPLIEVLSDALDEEDDAAGCTVCHL
jgi:hypothetical protein